MPEPCTHGMPNHRACWFCMEDGNLDPAPSAPVVTVARTLTARYDGHCSGCNLDIHPGHHVALLTDGTYRHPECADQALSFSDVVVADIVSNLRHDVPVVLDDDDEPPDIA